MFHSKILMLLNYDLELQQDLTGAEINFYIYKSLLLLVLLLPGEKVLRIHRLFRLLAIVFYCHKSPFPRV